MIYLYEGAIVHRDSIGKVQVIEPGAINWMTAGCGIVHSERTPPELAARAHRTHGLQLWAALPRAHEETGPGFVHTPAAAIPTVQAGTASVRVLIGRAFGAASPVAVLTDTLYLDLALPAGGTLTLPPLAAERALYGLDHPFRIYGTACAPHTMAVLEPGVTVRVSAEAPARMVLIGGEPLDGRRYLWWNFVSSRKERIHEAAHDWANGRFAGIAGETDFIPLPEKRYAG